MRKLMLSRSPLLRYWITDVIIFVAFLYVNLLFIDGVH